MTAYISVISHGHSGLINQLSCLSKLSKQYKVVVKSNKAGDDLKKLTDGNPNLHWIDSDYGLGFGSNNNFVFNHCRYRLGMEDNDYFIVLNPDVDIHSKEIEALISEMKVKESKISAINLYKDSDKTVYDNSIRKFPSFIQFFSSFLGISNDVILDKDLIKAPCYVEWAAGSFLAFKCSHYGSLNGFDENYFMYCEDIDICYRSYLAGERVLYFPDVRAVHLAKHANRRVFSSHFYWHVTSAVRFIFTTMGLTKLKSSCS